MIRSILAVLAGLVLAVIVVAVVEEINMVLFPFPASVDPNDRAALETAIANAPVHALILVPIGWFLGTLVGGFVAARLARRAPGVHASIIGGLLLASGLANLLMIPHPLWLWVAGLAAFGMGTGLAVLLARPRCPAPGIA